MFKEMKELEMIKVDGGLSGWDEDGPPANALGGGMPKGVGKICKHYGPAHYVKDFINLK